MPLNLQQTRADVDAALSQAISSRDVNEQRTSIQQQTSRLRQQAYLTAGEAIGRGIETGLTKAFDPTERLAKQNMIRQSQAQATDFQQRSFADQVRATGQRVQGQGIYDKLGIKDTPEQSFRNTAVTKYGKEIADALPQDVKEQGAAFFKEIRGPAGETTFHAYPKGVELKAGKYGSREYMGRSWEEAPEIRKELEEATWDRIENLPSMKHFMLERGQTVQLKNSLGKQGLSGSIAVWDATKNRELTEKSTQIEDMWNDDTKYDFQVGDQTVAMSLREAGAKNMIDQRFVRENIQNIVRRAPRMAVDAKGVYHPSFTPELLAQAVDKKDKLDAAVFRNFLNMESSQANSMAARWDSSKTAFNRVMSMDWLKALSPEQQKVAQERINNIAQLTKAQPRLGQVAIATKNGVAVGGDELADAIGTSDAVMAVGKINAELDALKAISPQVKDLMMPAAYGSKNKSQWDLIHDKAVESSMVNGHFAGAAGPLAKLMTKDVSDAEAAHIWNLMRDGAANSPQFDNLTARYTAAGMSPEDARSMGIAHGAEFERRLTIALSTPDPSGKGQEWTEAEKEEIADEIAKVVTGPSLKAFTINKGATGRAATNAVAGREPDTLSYNDAKEYADRALAAAPELKDKGLVELALGNDRTLIILNGKAAGYKKGDKATGFSLLKGEFPTHLTESLHAAAKMARDLVGIDLETNFRWDSLSPLKATGDKGVDKMMATPVGPDGQSTYLWLKNHFKSDMRLAKDSDKAQALYLNLMNAAKAAGQDPWQMKDRLTAAAANTEDPVLEATAIFIGEALSPHKVTLADLKNIEGGYPGGLVASIGAKKAQEDINSPPGGSEPKDIKEAWDANTQQGAQNIATTAAETDFTGTEYAATLGGAALGGAVAAGGLPGALASTAVAGGTMLYGDLKRAERRFERGDYFEEPGEAEAMERTAKLMNSPEWRKSSEENAAREAEWRKSPEAQARRDEIARADAARPARARQEDPFVETLRGAIARAEEIRRGEKPSAESPSRSHFLGPRAESAPASRHTSSEDEQERQRLIRAFDAEPKPETRAESRAESRAPSRPGYDQYLRFLDKRNAERRAAGRVDFEAQMTFAEWDAWKKNMEAFAK